MPFGGNFHPEWGALAPAPSFMRTARIVAVATAIGATAGAGVVLSLAGSSDAFSPQANVAPASDKPLVIVHSLVQPAEAAPAAAQPASSSVATAAPVNVPAIAPAAAVPVAAPAFATPASRTPTALSAPVVAAAPASPTPATTNVQQSTAAQALPTPADQASTPVSSDSHSASTPAVPASVAALAEIPPATEASPAPAPDVATFTADQSGAQKIDSKKLHGPDQAQQPHPQTATANSQSSPRKRTEARGLGPLLRHLFSARAGSTFPN